ncbi:MXAN_6230/SCO0854 family RING domain-containing protein [Streptacidiphilus sp. PAMC 29251]
MTAAGTRPKNNTGNGTGNTAGSATSLRSPAAVMLARRGSVYLPASVTEPAAGQLAGTALLEADLLERGYLLSAPLRSALASRSSAALTAAGRELLAGIDHELGADRPHLPLFRDFPHSIPTDTVAFYVDRVLTVLFQHPEQPCVLCGTHGTVHAVSPCAHLVCRACFDGSDFSACPICHRRIDVDDPFLLPRAPRRRKSGASGGPVRLRLLAHGGTGTDLIADAAEELRTLLARPGALSPSDADDLIVLLDCHSRSDLAWLPANIPGRETKARTLTWLLAAIDPGSLAAAAEQLDTATDVLRLLAVRSGGDPGLFDVPRFTKVPRPLRRTLLACLDRLDPATAVEEMRRRRRLWLHAAERLHPFEHASRHPRAALAFAALRGTPLTGDAPDGRAARQEPGPAPVPAPAQAHASAPTQAQARKARLSALLRTAAAEAPGVDVSGDTVLARGWGARVEVAFAACDTVTATTLLAQRPGELLRRLDHLLRTSQADDSLDGSGADSVVAALARVVGRVSPAVLLSALGEIRGRTRPAGRDRVFFPKGGSARIHLIEDERPPLPSALVEDVVTVLIDEVLRRAARGARVPVAVIDADLDAMIAPFTQRTASRSLVAVPRGSALRLPQGRTLRLFLHWMESETSGRVDLDLSIAMFDADWNHIGTCDFGNLRCHDAAVHSGDLTSAPPPLGAAEFVDLDLDRLHAAGVRYAVPVAFSYNNVAFEDLAEAFAGIMVRDQPGDTGEVFDARAVEQRFDLTGRSRASVPLIVDTAERTMRWLDVVKGVTGTDHSIGRHADDLALLGRALTEQFASGNRISLGELARWQAAARTDTVLLRRADHTAGSYRRRAGEVDRAFATRIGSPDTDTDSDTKSDTAPASATAGGAGLAYLLRGDLLLPKGCEVFALYPADLDAGAVKLLTADDIVTALAAD